MANERGFELEEARFLVSELNSKIREVAQVVRRAWRSAHGQDITPVRLGTSAELSPSSHRWIVLLTSSQDGQETLFVPPQGQERLLAFGVLTMGEERAGGGHLSVETMASRCASRWCEDDFAAVWQGEVVAVAVATFGVHPKAAPATAGPSDALGAADPRDLPLFQAAQIATRERN
ncbi:hypothetical protein AB1Y20_000515 [Prymnesium parvum]|uniref:Uncharacterized protein n=1 Tax=Prymnesium parvum TaxID=97485 RepID=A0AB34K9A3_PRYPA